MASTYSTSLRLELMATGDQSGTWGTTTNTNLGTLLEQAITGVLSVAEGDTTLTLTTVDGGSDQARNAVVNLTGAMTANRNVVVQTAAKVYLIKNSTTGGFNITVKTAAGTGVEIAPGTARWVYSDGTNVVDGQPGLSMGYTTTVTTAGTTTLTYGSTYYQYFTGSTTQTIVLPVATTMTLGQAFSFVNLSSGALTINSSGSNLVTTIAASSSAIVQCILTSGTSAASWNAVSVNLSGYLLLAGGTMTGPLVNTAASVGYTPFQGISTEAAAAAGPILELYRNSASPAANDIMGQAIFYGQNSTPTKKEYADISAVIVSPTAAAENGALAVSTIQAGTVANRLLVANGTYTAGATGGDKGANSINASTYYADGARLGPVVAAAQATTSGSSVTFTAPTGMTRPRMVIVSFASFSSNGTTVPLVQIGPSGGVENSGYLGSGVSTPNAAANVGVLATTGFAVTGSMAASVVIHGVMILILTDAATETWSAGTMIGRSDAATTAGDGGSKTISGVLNKITITVGADTLDLGKTGVTWF